MGTPDNWSDFQALFQPVWGEIYLMVLFMDEARQSWERVAATYQEEIDATNTDIEKGGKQ